MLVEGLLNGTRISAVLNVVDQIHICNRGAGAARKRPLSTVPGSIPSVCMVE